MSSGTRIAAGTILPDGKLELDEKLELEPGRVRVIIEPLPDLPEDDPFWQRMRRIWEMEPGYVPRSAAEVEAERETLRREWDERSEQIEALQESHRAKRAHDA
jgi:hypothetical protein